MPVAASHPLALTTPGAHPAGSPLDGNSGAFNNGNNAGPTRRFRAEDVSEQLDMKVIGELCVGIKLAGYQQLLGGFFADESGVQAKLLATLEAGQAQNLKPLAHALRGSSASLGLRGLAATVRLIEIDGATWTPEQTTAAGGQLRQQLGTVRGLLQRMGFL